MKRVPVLAFAVLIVNSAYLAAFAHPTVFYMANAVLHLVLGLLLMAFALPLVKRWPRESGLFLLCGVLGCYLAVRGNTMPHRWALYAHIGVAVAVLACISARLMRSSLPRWNVQVFAGLAAIFVILPLAA